MKDALKQSAYSPVVCMVLHFTDMSYTCDECGKDVMFILQVVQTSYSNTFLVSAFTTSQKYVNYLKEVNKIRNKVSWLKDITSAKMFRVIFFPEQKFW